MKSLFGEEETWYKGNLHMHTTKSDGEIMPEEAITYYSKAGYDFISLTDHWIENEELTQNGLLILSGCEWDTGDMFNTSIYHILGIGMNRKTGMVKNNTIPPQTIIDNIIKAGGIAVLAHPAWSLTDPACVQKMTGLSGVEIYNTISDVSWKNGRRADSSIYIDLWANQGMLMNCFAGDDCHFYTGEQTRSYIMVNAKERTREALMNAMRNGSFYASQGPEFQSILRDEHEVKVTCSKASKIVFYSNTVWCHDRVQVLTNETAVYEIKPTDKYVRVEIIDENGKMAWSNPFFVNSKE